MSIPKLILEFHIDQVSALQFSNTQPNLLFSSSYDKFIVLWKINPTNFSGEKLRVMQLQSEISDLALYPDDSHLLAGCFDNNVYVIKVDFQKDILQTVATLVAHDNIVNSISLDPFIETTGRFASLSDKGRLIISTFNRNENNVSILYNFEDFINPKHKCVMSRKKIDWSVDGKWVLSVDHHQIQKQNVIHAKLINMNTLPNTQALIGHDSPVLISSFSRCLYCENSIEGNNEEFQLCATSDKNGNLIIWKVDKDEFSVLVEISNYSESNVTNMEWSKNGEYLITVNSSGSVCAIEFNEFSIKVSNRSALLTPAIGGEVKKKKKIVPTLIQPRSMFDSAPVQQNENLGSSINGNNSINYFNSNQPCLKCQKQLYQSIENQVTDVVIENVLTKDKSKVHLTWENHPFDNCSIVSMKIDSKVLYSNKYLNRMIKLFTSNNVYFAFYDTNFTLNVYSILNTMLISKMYIEEISILSSFKQYILMLTSQNRMIILDVVTQEKVADEYLNLNSEPYNVFQTKIDTIYFVSLTQIIIKADSFNPYRNTNNKMLLYFDSKNKNLIMSSNSQLTQEETKLISNMSNEASYYNNYFEDKIEASKIESSLDNELYKISSEVNMIYENMYKSRYFGNTESYNDNVRQLIKTVRECGDKFNFILDDFIKYNNMFISEDNFNKLKEELIIQNKPIVESNQNLIQASTMQEAPNVQTYTNVNTEGELKANSVHQEEEAKKEEKMEIDDERNNKQVEAEQKMDSTVINNTTSNNQN